MTQASIDFWTQIGDGSSLTIGIILIITGLFRYKKINLPSKIILYANITGIAINFLSRVFPGKDGSNNPVFLYLSYFSSFILLALFYNYCLPRFRNMKLGIYVALAGFLFWLFYSIFFQPMAYTPTNHSYPYYVAFHGIVCIILSMLGLFFMSQDSTWNEIRNNPVFWFMLIDLFGTGFEFIYDIAVGMVKSNFTLFISTVFWDLLPNDLGAICTTIIFLKFPKKQLSQGNIDYDDSPGLPV